MGFSLWNSSNRSGMVCANLSASWSVTPRMPPAWPVCPRPGRDGGCAVLDRIIVRLPARRVVAATAHRAPLVEPGHDLPQVPHSRLVQCLRRAGTLLGREARCSAASSRVSVAADRVSTAANRVCRLSANAFQSADTTCRACASASATAASACRSRRGGLADANHHNHTGQHRGCDRADECAHFRSRQNFLSSCSCGTVL
ncbi:hypothetical protein I552_9749 [Mycobacterium xenopi 3993]|nr:hypothetical protein I552_9749 [Mycobacterium xenopi 3993]